MAINAKDLEEQMLQKGILSESNLFAWGRVKASAWAGVLGGAVGGAIAGAKAGMAGFAVKDDKLILIPFNNKEIFFDKAVQYKKENIVSMKITSDLFSFGTQFTLKLNFKDGTKADYTIIKTYKNNVVAMINLLGK